MIKFVFPAGGARVNVGEAVGLSGLMQKSKRFGKPNAAAAK